MQPFRTACVLTDLKWHEISLSRGNLLNSPPLLPTRKFRSMDKFHRHWRKLGKIHKETLFNTNTVRTYWIRKFNVMATWPQIWHTGNYLQIHFSPKHKNDWTKKNVWWCTCMNRVNRNLGIHTWNRRHILIITCSGSMKINQSSSEWKKATVVSSNFNHNDFTPLKDPHISRPSWESDVEINF